MKIRTGFVSNSSSSSFVLYGIKLKSEENIESLCRKFLTEEQIKECEYEGEVDWYDCFYENNVETKLKLDVISCGYSGDLWIGKTIITGDYDLENGEIDITELKKIDEKINDIFPDLNHKLYYGTYGC
jgi:hypothetical protein